MKEHLELIDRMLKYLAESDPDESDLRFIKQIYTLLKRHLTKKRGH